MKNISWQGFKKTMGVLTWFTVTLMLLYHIHQTISRARAATNRSDRGLVIFTSKETQ
ncbi:MAG: hypothetical protein WBA13_08910 [Microcoleaceae cyanobacterium]